jgi:hypothetical protein
MSLNIRLRSRDSQVTAIFMMHRFFCVKNEFPIIIPIFQSLYLSLRL